MARTKKEKTAKEMFEDGRLLIIQAFCIKERESANIADYQSAQLMVDKRNEFVALMQEEFDQYFQGDGK